MFAGAMKDGKREPARHPGDELLTVAEVAALLKVSSKRVRNLMSGGTFQVGRHFLRPSGLGPRFLKSRLEAWLRGSDASVEDSIPMSRHRRQRTASRAANPA